MKISVHVTPRSSREGVEPAGPVSPTGGSVYMVRVHAAPADGEANDAVIRLLADHFDVPKTRVTIIRGHRSRRKLVEIL